MTITASETGSNPEIDFSDRIRVVRRKVAKMGQAEMAAELNVTIKAYSAWESGRYVPSDLVAVAKRVEMRWRGQVTAAWMLGVDTPTSTPPPADSVPYDSKRNEIELMRQRRSPDLVPLLRIAG